MASSYLKQPLRTLEQALEDRTQVQAPGAVPAQATEPVASEPGPIELLINLLSGNGLAGADRDGATTNR